MTLIVTTVGSEGFKSPGNLDTTGSVMHHQSGNPVLPMILISISQEGCLFVSDKIRKCHQVQNINLSAQWFISLDNNDKAGYN